MIKNKNILYTLGASLVTTLALGVAFFGSHDFVLIPANANETPFILNHSNAPTLSGGTGTMVDVHGVTWEYYNCADYVSGHITVNHTTDQDEHHGGYFGIASTSAYGYTGITSITANFGTTTNELWLLSSIDGVIWSEVQILESGTSVTTANNWRYIRFYNWSDNNTSIDINSVEIAFSCSGISSPEDVDGAKDSNVKATSQLTHAPEYSDLSPNSVGGEAVKFTKEEGAGNTDLTIGFGKTYKIGDIQNSKVEFDMKTANINYGKSIALMMTGSANPVGSTIFSNKASSYKCTNIQGDWYHIEVPITTFISTISGYDGNDKPHTGVENKQVDSIKINAGNCVIDNLRINSSPCELGIFNNPSYNPKLNEVFWVKVSWVGVLHPEQVTMSFNDPAKAQRIPLDDPKLMNGSPFYIKLLGTGSLTVTVTVVSGYDRSAKTVQHTINNIT